MEAREITADETVAAAKTLAAAARARRPATWRYETSELGSCGLYCHRWGAAGWVLGTPAEPAALAVVSPAKRARTGWGRYLNRILIVTHPDARGTGCARALDDALLAHYLDAGYTRVKTTSGTRAGWAVHTRRGWPAWALNPKGQLVHDAPLTADFDRAGIPPAAAALGATRPLTLTEQHAALDDPNGPYAPLNQAVPSPVMDRELTLEDAAPLIGQNPLVLQMMIEAGAGWCFFRTATGVETRHNDGTVLGFQPLDSDDQATGPPVIYANERRD